MKKRSWKKGLAAVLGLVLSIHAPVSTLFPTFETYAYTERVATVNASSLNVRSGPGTSYSQVTRLDKGASVTVIGESNASDGKLWYQIRFTGSGGVQTTGYALSTYVRFPVTYTHDANFESHMNAQGFPDSYKDGLRQLHAQYPNWVFVAQQTGLDWNTVIENETILGRSLIHKNSISSHKSIQDGAYDWDNGTWTGFDGSTWVAASDDLVRYFMDPRNFLDDVYIFQFLAQQYDASIHTSDGLEGMLKGTFMQYNAPAGGDSGSGSSSNVVEPDDSAGQPTSGVIVAPSGNTGPGNTGSGSNSGEDTGNSDPGSETGQGNVSLEAPQASISKHNAAIVATSYGPGVVSDGPGGSSGASGGQTADITVTGSGSYVDIIMNAASQSGVNPYVLAAMIIQEQGTQGASGSISGTYSGYEGYYNYFNVGAYQDGGMSAVERGLWYASQSDIYGRPWNAPEKAIVGGAQFYGSTYVNTGQDTFYLKKYNVQGSNMYKHQYMTNVDAAAAEACLFAEAYNDGLRSKPLQFKIPVYTNMPASACTKPTGDGSPNNKLRELGVEGFTLTPTYHRDILSYDLIVDHSVSSVNVSANAADSAAVVNGKGNILLQSGNNDITVSVTAQNGCVRDYIIHVVRQNGGPTYNSGLGGGTGSDTGSDTGGSTNPGSISGGPGAAGPAGGSDHAVTPGGDNIIIIDPGG